MLASFEVSRVEPRLAGLNLVSPEDNATALQDYDLQMSMIGMLGDEFRGKSPLRVTLHAGELTPAIVPPAHPEYLSAHVRNAVEIAHAERIGHGVDVLGERDAPGLLAEMRAKGVTVEICLTSNDTILGVSGPKHPLSAYLAAGVPVTLATDDAGVSRGSLTGEYTRAVAAQGITYPQLKAMARRSLTAAFVPGASLWASPDALHPVDACAGAVGGVRPCPRARRSWRRASARASSGSSKGSSRRSSESRRAPRSAPRDGPLPGQRVPRGLGLGFGQRLALGLRLFLEAHRSLVRLQDRRRHGGVPAPQPRVDAQFFLVPIHLAGAGGLGVGGGAHQIGEGLVAVGQGQVVGLAGEELLRRPPGSFRRARSASATAQLRAGQEGIGGELVDEHGHLGARLLGLVGHGEQEGALGDQVGEE